MTVKASPRRAGGGFDLATAAVLSAEGLTSWLRAATAQVLHHLRRVKHIRSGFPARLLALELNTITRLHVHAPRFKRVGLILLLFHQTQPVLRLPYAAGHRAMVMQKTARQHLPQHQSRFPLPCPYHIHSSVERTRAFPHPYPSLFLRPRTAQMRYSLEMPRGRIRPPA
jgi:hypothetical protein